MWQCYLPYVEESTSWMMICCRGRQRLQVEENVRPPGQSCGGHRRASRAQGHGRARERAHGRAGRQTHTGLR